MIESAQNGTNNITDHEIKEEVDTIMFEVSNLKKYYLLDSTMFLKYMVTYNIFLPL